MTKFPLQQRTLALLAIVAPLLLLFVYVVFRSGPLAPVAVTVATVDERAIAPGLFGVGTVEARYAYKIGPTAAGRIQRLDVHVGDLVKAGQVLGEMDPVDLDDRVQAQASAARRAEAALREAEARQDYAKTQAKRYEELLTVRSTSEETVATRRQELQIADAALSAARLDVVRLRADLDGLRAQRRNLRLIAPADGLVAAREADPGTTVVAGQTVIEIKIRRACGSTCVSTRSSLPDWPAVCPRASSCVRVTERPCPAGFCAWNRKPMRSPRSCWPRSFLMQRPDRCRRWANWPRSPSIFRPARRRRRSPTRPSGAAGMRSASGRSMAVASPSRLSKRAPRTSPVTSESGKASKKATRWWSIAKRR